MYEVIRKKDEHSAKLLIAAGIELSKIPNNQDVPILKYACIFGNIELVKIFLAVGANLNVKNFQGEILLEELCSKEKIELAQIVFDHMKDQNQIDLKGMPPIKISKRSKFLNSLELLPQNTSQMDSQIVEFHMAVYNSDLEKVETLINSGVNGEKLAKFDRAILHLARVRGNKDIVRLLLNCGVDVNIKDSEDITALDVCLNAICEPIIEMILEHIIRKSIIYTDSSSLNTRLHYLSLIDNAKLVRTFLERGTNINSLNADKKTALNLAALFGNEFLFFALLEKGASTYLESEWRTILIFPCLYGYINIIKRLLELNVNMEPKNHVSRGALHAAAFAGHLEVIKLLVSSGVNIDLQDHFGFTPLHLAIENSNIEAIRWLIQAGANLEIKDNLERDALKIAEAIKNKEVETTISKTTNYKEEKNTEIRAPLTSDQQIFPESFRPANSPNRINSAFPLAKSGHSK